MAQGGKTFQDREKASEVRSRVLDCIKLVLSDEGNDLEKVEKWSDYKLDLVKRMSTSILPRLNEVAGPDGGPIEIKGVEISVRE